MAGKLDLTIDRGATFHFNVHWGYDDDGSTSFYNLIGCSAVLLLWDTDRAYSTSQSPLVINSDNSIDIELSNKQTRELPQRCEYAIEVTFPSGDVRHVLEGHFYGSHNSRRDM